MSTSARGSLGCPFMGDVRSSKRRKMVGDANRNKASSGYAVANVNNLAAEPQEQGGSMPFVPIDVDSFDDDVLVSSPMAFAQARNNSRRNREKAVIIDVESDERMHRVAPSSHKRRRGPSVQPIVDCDLYICWEGPSRAIAENVQIAQPPPSLPPPPPPPLPAPPKEPTFSCPICMGSLDAATSTKCGHIFCKPCLQAAIAAQKKCPTCRARITTMRSTFRVYLPTTR